MPSKSWWQVPFEPQMQQMFVVLLLPSLYGTSSPSLSLSWAILSGAMGSIVSTLIVCGWSYVWLLGSKEQAVQSSRVASDARQSMGYGPFALRLLLLLWMLGALMGSALWVSSRLIKGIAPPLTLCLLSASVGATVVALCLFVQAVALDRHYQTKP